MVQLSVAMLALIALLAVGSAVPGAAAAAAAPSAVVQLDVCNKHRTVADAPSGTSLTITKDGMCVLTSQVLTSCAPSAPSPALLLRFPCKEGPREKQASGPALNVWASSEGVPQPSKRGMVVNELGSRAAALAIKPAGGAAAAAAAAAAPSQASGTAGGSSPSLDAALGAASSCALLTLNPGLYYHKSPPMLTYGYVISGLPCSRAASAAGAVGVLEQAGAKTFPSTYSIWLKPALPAPPKSMSAELQSCHLVISVLNRSYVSTDTYPCSMKELTPDEVGDGCCYNAGGAPSSGRRLLSSWERLASYRRAMQH